MPSAVDMTKFKEKVESLFLWGHQLEGVDGVPGVTSKPTQFSAGKANLSFKSWKRNAVNTSLQAGVQYGPSLSDHGGLGFLHYEEGSLYRVTKRGEALAEALDERLRRRESYTFLTDLELMHASEAQAKDLFPAWRVDDASEPERKIFREGFFDETATGADNLARRSTMIELVREVLGKSRKALSVPEIRRCMAYGRQITGKQLDPRKAQEAVSRKWALLQIRQAQRLALESLLGWLEHRMLKHGDRDARKLADVALKNLRKNETSHFRHETPADALSDWLGRFKTFEVYVDAVFKDEQRFCVFSICDELGQLIRNEPEEICEPAFKLLLLCRRFVDWFANDPDLQEELLLGGAARISLEYWASTWDKNRNYPLTELVALVLNHLVLSQHFAVATNRFDGGTQRLRIAIEEEGLEALVGKPWRPYIAADRLGTLLSLMADCGLIKWNADNDRYFV